jgi:hypothetical protein
VPSGRRGSGLARAHRGHGARPARRAEGSRPRGQGAPRLPRGAPRRRRAPGRGPSARGRRRGHAAPAGWRHRDGGRQPERDRGPGAGGLRVREGRRVRPGGERAGAGGAGRPLRSAPRRGAARDLRGPGRRGRAAALRPRAEAPRRGVAPAVHGVVRPVACPLHGGRALRHGRPEAAGARTGRGPSRRGGHWPSARGRWGRGTRGSSPRRATSDTSAWPPGTTRGRKPCSPARWPAGRSSSAATTCAWRTACPAWPTRS